MTRLVWFVIGLSIIAAIGATLAVPGSASKSCGKGGKMTFEDWRTWTKVTPKPLVSEGHGGQWVGVYVTDLAKDIYLAGGAPYPKCAKIVKPLYAAASGSKVEELMIMVKMPAGYDSYNGDWWYGVYDASGTGAMKEGKLGGCMNCHYKALQTDYLFSKEVLEAIKPKSSK